MWWWRVRRCRRHVLWDGGFTGRPSRGTFCHRCLQPQLVPPDQRVTDGAPGTWGRWGEQQGWWEDTCFLLFSRSLPALLTCDSLCWLEAGCGTGWGCEHRHRPGSATGTIPAAPWAAVLGKGSRCCQRGRVSVTGRRVQPRAGRAGRVGEFMAGITSFAGHLFHSWKQDYVLPVLESCKPTPQLLPGCGQVPGGVAKVSMQKTGVCPETCDSNLGAQHHF